MSTFGSRVADQELERDLLVEQQELDEAHHTETGSFLPSLTPPHGASRRAPCPTCGDTRVVPVTHRDGVERVNGHVPVEPCPDCGPGADYCVCGHPSGDHQGSGPAAAGIRVSSGICLVCDCRRFVLRDVFTTPDSESDMPF